MYIYPVLFLAIIYTAVTINFIQLPAPDPTRTPAASDAREGFGAALAATGGRRSLEPPAVVPQAWEGGTSTNSRRASPAQSTTGTIHTPYIILRI